MCWTDAAVAELKPRPLHEVLGAMADRQHSGAQSRMAKALSGDKPRAIVEPMFDRLNIGELTIGLYRPTHQKLNSPDAEWHMESHPPSHGGRQHCFSGQGVSPLPVGHPWSSAFMRAVRTGS